MNVIEVPDSTESLHNIGAFIMEYDARQNAFLNALVNRIARVIITSKMWNNPWAVFKQGTLEMGETVEEIFVNIGRSYSFNPADSEKTLFKREMPDVRAAFHTMNYQKMYPITISEDQLRQAFLSWSELSNLVAKIIESVYTAMRYDEFTAMKYMLARECLNGGLYVEHIAPLDSEANFKEFIAMQVANAGNLEILSTDYNRAHVYNATDMSDQYFIMSNATYGKVNVEVLAAAFNMSKAEFAGRIIRIDGFDKQDKERLDQLFENDKNYTYFTPEELGKLASIGGVQMDKNWWMVFDNMEKMTNVQNAKGLYWNYFLHAWKTFSVSPYANAIVYYADATSITAVAVSPESASLSAGASLQLTATVSGSGLFDKSVEWSISGQVSAETNINGNNGILHIGVDEPAGSSVTVTATTVNGKTDSATITVTA